MLLSQQEGPREDLSRTRWSLGNEIDFGGDKSDHKVDTRSASGCCRAVRGVCGCVSFGLDLLDVVELLLD